MKMPSIFCCCRQREHASFDPQDPNTVSVLPTAAGKLQPTPLGDSDTDHVIPQNIHPERYTDPVPPPGHPLYHGKVEEDPELLPVSIEDDGSIMGAVNELDNVINSEQIKFYDCIDDNVTEQVREFCKEMTVSDDTLRMVMSKLHEQMLLGLDPATKEIASTKCWNTYVQDLPTGKEVGTYLALDLGGTNFRVLLVRLDNDKFDMKSKIYVIPPEIMLGPGEDLFDHIADCLASFAKEHRVNKENLPLGFTFSFPLQQSGLQKGILQRWTKGFNCDGVIGEDVVQLLDKAVKKRDDLSLDVVAILNDTTGTLMSCAWKNHNTKMGVILGTGTNACYVENIDNIKGFDGNQCKPQVLINIEWGAFGDNGELEFISTCYDKEIDVNSLNPGKQIFEKMISGMYLGELVRLILCKLAKEKVIFNGKISDDLATRESFKTSFLSDIEADKKGCYIQCKKVLESLKLCYTDQDCANVRYICECVSRRAACLASAGVATVLNKMECPSVTVGVDGSLYRYHPYFHDVMTEKLVDLVDPPIKCQLMLSEDGSGRGAALVAAAAAGAKKK